MAVEYIAILIPFAGMALGGWIAYIAITASHRENIAMIEAGMNPKEREEKKKEGNKWRWALILIFVPIGIIFGRLMAEPFGLEMKDGSIVFAFMFGGIGLAVSHFFQPKKEEEKN